MLTGQRMYFNAGSFRAIVGLPALCFVFTLSLLITAEFGLGHVKIFNVHRLVMELDCPELTLFV